MLVKDFVLNLAKELKIAEAEPWDPVGFSISPRGRKKLTNVLITLDIDQNAIDIAIKNNVNLIISHHPFIFYTKEKEFAFSQAKQKQYELLKQHKICTYSFHTAFDKTRQLTAKSIALGLGFEEKQFIKKTQEEFGEFVLFVKANIDTKELIQKIKRLKITHIQANFDTENQQIKTLAIFPGSGPYFELIKAAKKAQVIVSSDAKWSDLVAYKNEGVRLINVSHSLEAQFINSMLPFVQKVINNEGQVLVSWPQDLLKNI
ncbi:Nif3-like dinuclear metal center hexameric protein [Mycoplasma sp. 128]